MFTCWCEIPRILNSISYNDQHYDNPRYIKKGNLTADRFEMHFTEVMDLKKKLSGGNFLLKESGNR